MKKVLLSLLLALAMALSVCTVTKSVTKVYCDENTVETPSASTGSFTELYDSVDTGLKDVKEKVGSISTTVAVVMLIICFLGLIFFKNSQKVAQLFTKIGVIIGAFVGIQVVANNWLTSALTDLVAKYFHS